MNIVTKTTETSRVERIGTHSHITGLGLDEALQPKVSDQGMVGQLDARRAAGVVVRLIQEHKLAGRALLIAGPPGTGKTALAMGIAQSIGISTPFTSISGSEVYSLEMSKSEALMQAFRRSIAVKIKERSVLVEGEVVDIKLNRAQAGPAVATTKVGTLTLKTTDMQASYEISEKIVDFIQKEKITPGDVISFDKTNGKITKLGRSYSHSYDYDAVSSITRFVQCPSGELERVNESVHTVSLHEIDVINSRSQGFLALFNGETGEISNDIRDQINLKIAQWKLEGKCELIPGVLFIDECHMLDIECFSFINRALESDLAPIVIFATNRGISVVRGTDIASPHGLPRDLLDRMLIVPTEKYKLDESAQIIRIRAREEGISLTERGLATLATISDTTSLRYALNLLSLSSLIALKQRMTDVSEVHIDKAYKLFQDQQRSSVFVASHSQELSQ